MDTFFAFIMNWTILVGRDVSKQGIYPGNINERKFCRSI